MAENDYVPGEMDVQMQKGTYDAVMGFGARHGVGFSLGVAFFFAALLRDSGMFFAFILFAAIYISCYWIVKLFFTH